MKITTYKESQTYTNAVSLSESKEYPIDDHEIDCAIVKVNGQYPGNNKFAVNEKSKELLFVVEGEGTIEIKNGEIKEFGKYDTILIDRGELYRFNAHASFCVVCTPPWTPEQHKNVD